MTCPHRLDVGVYLLGALDPAERSAFEEHLDGCATCTTDLRELGGLPGLLARVPAPEVTDPARSAAAPDVGAPGSTLLAGVVAHRRRDRRRRLLVAAAVVLVALVGGAGVGALVARSDTGAPASPAVAVPVRTLALQPVGGAPVDGSAGLSTRPWGTQVSLHCRYLGATRSGGSPATPAPPVYVLVVRGPTGPEQQLARWSPPPGQDVDVGGATDLPVAQVARLEVRTDTGRVLMASGS